MRHKRQECEATANTNRRAAADRGPGEETRHAYPGPDEGVRQAHMGPGEGGPYAHLGQDGERQHTYGVDGEAQHASDPGQGTRHASGPGEGSRHAYAGPGGEAQHASDPGQGTRHAYPGQGEGARKAHMGRGERAPDAAGVRCRRCLMRFRATPPPTSPAPPSPPPWPHAPSAPRAEAGGIELLRCPDCGRRFWADPDGSAGRCAVGLLPETGASEPAAAGALRSRAAARPAQRSRR